ncbi:phosphatidate cytidylyltransferase [Accumulibacter sp.]|uniref:phosphatidate cytidylyltransferase n=1 Tax=Accumulibacter sp. TaxID=2053492 RepID=UPI00260FB635|nr:phosphatidate cytidylyltransferase [Accumulibacter sp.]
MLGADDWRLAAGVASVLAIASLAGQLLKTFVAGNTPHALIDNLNRRIASWWGIVALVGLALLAGRGAVTLLFALVSLVALHEFLAGEALVADCPRTLVVGSFVLIVPLQYLLVWTDQPWLYSALIPLLVFVGRPLLGLLSGDCGAFLGATRTLGGGLLTCVFGLSHIPALLTLPAGDDPAAAARRMIFLLLVVQVSDVLQYVWGKLAGRHPIAPRLSPSKTIEGTLGGIASAIALGTWLSWLTKFSPLKAGLISLLLTLLGFAGGLAMSAAKRRRGIKDWSRLIPGHGGMLDRVDSLVLSAPAFYYLLRSGWVA